MPMLISPRGEVLMLGILGRKTPVCSNGANEERFNVPLEFPRDATKHTHSVSRLKNRRVDAATDTRDSACRVSRSDGRHIVLIGQVTEIEVDLPSGLWR